MQPLKELLGPKQVKALGNSVQNYSPKFDAQAFQKQVIPKLAKLELKERVQLISEALHQQMQALPIEQQLLALEQVAVHFEGFSVWPLTHYVQTYALDSVKLALNCLEVLTKRFTAEFAIRHFINRHPKQSYSALHRWSQAECEHLRRLASEGTRPNLPWGVKLEAGQKYQAEHLKILERLHTDESLYVRTSVANHLNDYSLIDLPVLLKVTAAWAKKPNAHTPWILNKALRRPLKQGNAKALQICGYSPRTQVTSAKVHTQTTKPKVGKSFEILCEFNLRGQVPKKLMVDFVLTPQKTGKTKVFKWKKGSFNPGKHCLSKKLTLKHLSTQKIATGKYLLQLQVNGKITAENTFELKS